jgi:hypothetical protein
VAFIDINNVFQLGMAIGIPTILMFIYVQIRGWMKESHKQQIDNRLAITTEINTKTEQLFTTIETKLEAIKVAALVGKEDITLLKVQLLELQSYVNELDKEGTVEWKRTKPFILEKIENVAQRITELENRYRNWTEKEEARLI